MESHLLQMRGLKQYAVDTYSRTDTVASFTDAWIETKVLEDEILRSESHLLQMRGLKHLSLDGKHHGHKVASFTDAWIETFQTDRPALTPKVASFTDAWIETLK